MKHQDQYYMKQALKEAKKALEHEEIPVGAIIVDSEGNILSRAYNKKEEAKDVSFHAEILAIKKAEKRIKNWRLNNCVIYVTLEPCLMCGSAIIQSRIKKVVIGASEPNSGCFGSKSDINQIENENLVVVKDVLKNECSEVLVSFFQSRRKK